MKQITDLKIAVLIPTRGNRELFLDNCLRMMKAQTLQPAFIKVMGEEPVDDQKDITKRYRLGYDYLKGCGYDLIACVEDDDYYAPNYLEVMATEWLKAGEPDLCGTAYTYYYHINLLPFFSSNKKNFFAEEYFKQAAPKYPCACVKLNHPQRASMMNTLIKPDLALRWPEDTYAFTDLHLWNQTVPQPLRKPVLTGHLFEPEKPIALGIKHGQGITGGLFHADRLERFNLPDFDLAFLKSVCDEESFEFYTGICGKAAGLR